MVVAVKKATGIFVSIYKRKRQHWTLLPCLGKCHSVGDASVWFSKKNGNFARERGKGDKGLPEKK